MTQALSDASVAVLTDYRGMKVSQMQELRRALKGVGGDYQVVKNTLARLAVAGTSVQGLAEHFTGPVGLVIGPSGDPVSPSKILEAFRKDFPEAPLDVKVGMLQGKLLDEAGLKALAKLPGREQLLSMLLSVLQGPARNFVCVLAAVPRDLVGVLDAIRRKKEEAGAA